MTKKTLQQKQQQLDLLISSQQNMVSKSALTPRGEGYLEGLKAARKLFFDDQKNKK